MPFESATPCSLSSSRKSAKQCPDLKPYWMSHICIEFSTPSSFFIRSFKYLRSESHYYQVMIRQAGWLMCLCTSLRPSSPLSYPSPKLHTSLLAGRYGENSAGKSTNNSAQIVKSNACMRATKSSWASWSSTCFSSLPSPCKFLVWSCNQKTGSSTLLAQRYHSPFFYFLTEWWRLDWRARIWCGLLCLGVSLGWCILCTK